HLADVAEFAIPLADEMPPPGPVPLTPIARMFLATRGPLRHFNQAIVLQVPPRLDAERLARALRELVVRHDALRLRLRHDGDGWHQEIMPAEASAVDLKIVNLGATGPSQRSAQIATAGTDLQARLDPERGPLLGAIWFDCGDEPSRLLLACHHLAVDGVSWRILVEELRAADEALAHGTLWRPPRTSTFARWAHRLHEQATAPEIVATLPYWQTLSSGNSQLPRDRPGPTTNRVGNAGRLTTALDEATTARLLRDALSAYRLQIDDLLLTALALALAQWRSSCDAENATAP